jgi:hypothetical protein
MPVCAYRGSDSASEQALIPTLLQGVFLLHFLLYAYVC